MTTDTAIVLTLLGAVLRGGLRTGEAVVSGPGADLRRVGNGVGPLRLQRARRRSGGTSDVQHVLAQLALTVILFNQAVELDLVGRVMRRRELTFRLLVIRHSAGHCDLASLTALLLFPGDARMGGGVPGGHRRADGGRTRRHPPGRTNASPNGFDMQCPPRAVSTTGSPSPPCSPRWRWRRNATDSATCTGAAFLLRTEVLSVVVGLAMGAARRMGDRPVAANAVG